MARDYIYWRGDSSLIMKRNLLADALCLGQPQAVFPVVAGRWENLEQLLPGPPDDGRGVVAARRPEKGRKKGASGRLKCLIPPALSADRNRESF